MTTFRAVYEGGVLRPMEPLTLAEGQVVVVRVVPEITFLPPLPPPTAEELAYVERLKNAKSVDEMFAIMNTAPPMPEGYDLCEALNANRAAEGRPLLYPTADKDKP